MPVGKYLQLFQKAVVVCGFLAVQVVSLEETLDQPFSRRCISTYFVIGFESKPFTRVN